MTAFCKSGPHDGLNQAVLALGLARSPMDGMLVKALHACWPLLEPKKADPGTSDLPQVLNISKRTYQLNDVGLEIFFPGRNSLFLTFKSEARRDQFLRVLRQQPELKLEHVRSPAKWMRYWRQGKVGGPSSARHTYQHQV